MDYENVLITDVKVSRDYEEDPVLVTLRLEGIYTAFISYTTARISELLDLFETNDINNIKDKACRAIIQNNIIRGLKHLYKEEEVYNR